MYENDGHIHVYSPGAGADKPPAVKVLSLTVFVSQYSPFCKFSPNVQVTKFDLAVKQVKVNPGSSFI